MWWRRQAAPTALLVLLSVALCPPASIATPSSGVVAAEEIVGGPEAAAFNAGGVRQVKLEHAVDRPEVVPPARVSVRLHSVCDGFSDHDWVGAALRPRAPPVA